MHLLTKIRGWTQSGPMGNDKQVIPPAVVPVLVGAGISAAISIGSAISASRRAKKAEEARKRRLRRAKKHKLRDIKEKKRISPEQAVGMQKLRKGAQRGMIDVPGQTQQIGQEQYQRGEAQEAQATGQLTAQGLEGSIVAQDVSSRIGAETRAATAEQARQIAFKNQQSKQQAEQKLHQQLFKRRGLLEDLAFQKRAVREAETMAQLQSADQGQQQQDAIMAQFWESMARTAGSTYQGYMEASAEVETEG